MPQGMLLNGITRPTKKKKKKFHEQEDLLSCGGLRAVRLESQIT